MTLKKNQWFRVSPNEMGRELKIATGCCLLGGCRCHGLTQVVSSIGGGGIRMPTNNHLQYVLTWYGMALGLLVLSFFLLVAGSPLMLGAAFWKQSGCSRGAVDVCGVGADRSVRGLHP